MGDIWTLTGKDGAGTKVLTPYNWPKMPLWR